jgi:hypothetical protein
LKSVAAGWDYGGLESEVQWKHWQEFHSRPITRITRGLAEATVGTGLKRPEEEEDDVATFSEEVPVEASHRAEVVVSLSTEEKDY